jgi:hypothetical protein
MLRDLERARQNLLRAARQTKQRLTAGKRYNPQGCSSFTGAHVEQLSALQRAGFDSGLTLVDELECGTSGEAVLAQGPSLWRRHALRRVATSAIVFAPDFDVNEFSTSTEWRQ